jgi:hypothetical protein
MTGAIMGAGPTDLSIRKSVAQATIAVAYAAAEKVDEIFVATFAGTELRKALAYSEVKIYGAVVAIERDWTVEAFLESREERRHGNVKNRYQPVLQAFARGRHHQTRHAICKLAALIALARHQQVDPDSYLSWRAEWSIEKAAKALRAAQRAEAMRLQIASVSPPVEISSGALDAGEPCAPSASENNRPEEKIGASEARDVVVGGLPEQDTTIDFSKIMLAGDVRAAIESEKPSVGDEWALIVRVTPDMRLTAIMMLTLLSDARTHGDGSGRGSSR